MSDDCGHTHKMKVEALDDACPLCLQIKLNQFTNCIEQLKAALREIAFDDITGASIQHKEIARAALAPEQDK